MGNFLSIPLLGLAAAMQAGLVPHIRILGGTPDLVFLLVLAWAINARLEDGILWAFVGGIMQDLLSAAPLGTSTFGLLLVVFGISGLGQQVYRIGFLMLIGITLIGSLVHQLTALIVMIFFGLRIDLSIAITYVIAPTLVYNIVLIGPVYWFISRLQRRVIGDKGGVSVR